MEKGGKGWQRVAIVVGDAKGVSNVVGMNKCYPPFPHSNPHNALARSKTSTKPSSATRLVPRLTLFASKTGHRHHPH